MLWWCTTAVHLQKFWQKSFNLPDIEKFKGCCRHVSHFFWSFAQVLPKLCAAQPSYYIYCKSFMEHFGFDLTIYAVLHVFVLVTFCLLFLQIKKRHYRHYRVSGRCLTVSSEMQLYNMSCNSVQPVASRVDKSAITW